MKIVSFLTFVCQTAIAAGMSTNEAFDAGKTFSNENIGTAKESIKSGTASDTVPNYTTTSPESSYYMGGKGSLTAPASGQVTECTSTTSDPDPHTHGKCESVRLIMKDPGKKGALYPIDKNTDPLMTKRNEVRDGASTYLGSSTPTGSYSGCTEKTIVGQEKYITEHCNQYVTTSEERCQEILTVTITTSESCVPGTWYGGFQLGVPAGGWINVIDVYCDMSRSDGMLRLRFTPTGLHGTCEIGYLDVPKDPFTVSDRVSYGKTGSYCDSEGCWDTWGYINYETTSIHHWKGSCTVKSYIGYEPGYTQGCVGDVCSYTFRAMESRWGNQAVASAGPFTPPKMIVTETDTWDNQCSALEARMK